MQPKQQIGVDNGLDSTRVDCSAWCSVSASQAMGIRCYFDDSNEWVLTTPPLKC